MNNDNITLDENLVRNKREVANLSDSEIFTKIWTEPRLVFEYIHRKKYDQWILPIIIASGVNSLKGNPFSGNPAEAVFGIISFLFFLLIGGLIGLVVTYIFSWVLKIVGVMMGGNIKTYDLFRIVAYSQIPSAAGAILLLIFSLLFIFIGINTNQSWLLYFNYGLLGLTFALSLWSIYNLIVGISFAQKFSMGKAFVNFLVTLLLIVAPVVLIVLAVLLG